LSIEVINPLEIPNWDDLIQSFPEHTFFHGSGWARVLSASYGYAPFYFSLWDGGKLTAVVPFMEVKSFLTGRRGVSLPFTDFCDPLVWDKEKNSELFEAITETGLKRGWRFLEFRGGKDFLGDQSPSDSYYLHALELNTNLEKIYSRLKESHQRNIKKAQKQGLKVELFRSPEAVQQFYRLNSLTRRDHGLPPQPFYFFENINDLIISRNQGFVALADYEGKKIAGAVFFQFGRKAVYKYGASDKKFQSLRANNLVMWEAIKWLAENNYQDLHFGRTDLGHEGLRRFKSSWGAVETQISYRLYDLKNRSFQAKSRNHSDFPKKIFSRMPIPVLNLIGSLAYRHMG
jgi:hypothetical protein